MSAGLLVDQCVSRVMAREVYGSLTDIAYVWDLIRHAPDQDVLVLARTSSRVLLTEDYDFGRMIFREMAAPPAGLIHLAFAGMEKAGRYERLHAVAEETLKLAVGHFVLVGPNRIRTRRFPAV